MKKLSFILLGCLAFASEVEKGKEIFEKKCSSCHIEYIEPNKIKENFFKKDNKLLNLKAPTLNMISWAINEGPKRIGADVDLDFKIEEVADFLKDYLYNPDREKSICDPKVLSYMPPKPSMKGEVSEEELELIAHYLVNYKPLKSNKEVEKKRTSLEGLIKEAQKSNRYILVEVSSKLCPYCMKMKKEVFSDRSFREFLDKNYLFKEIVIEEESLPKELAKEYRGLTPTFFILNSRGEIVDYLVGAFSKEEFIKKLKKIKESKR
ncbi:MAG: thioredoxin fold domain-containing protein [Epsilonproteobacteria bacterium]|nr:thioredoxin fold domain-containing protein [Campylobacterota bacterium]